MDKFVLGFAFTEDASSVLLIRKLRPKWMEGFLNGIGGHIENNESLLEAMHRECKEETGLSLDWKQKGVLKGRNNDGASFHCGLFYSYSQEVLKYKQREDELLGMYNTLNIDCEQTITNLKFLIPYGKHRDGSTFMTLEY